MCDYVLFMSSSATISVIFFFFLIVAQCGKLVVNHGQVELPDLKKLCSCWSSRTQFPLFCCGFSTTSSTPSAEKENCSHLPPVPYLLLLPLGRPYLSPLWYPALQLLHCLGMKLDCTGSTGPEVSMCCVSLYHLVWCIPVRNVHVHHTFSMLACSLVRWPCPLALPCTSSLLLPWPLGRFSSGSLVSSTLAPTRLPEYLSLHGSE